jgi:hypothetical protein
MIIIHYDYTDGTEISYVEGLNCDKDFTTHCLEFFSAHYVTVGDIIVMCKDGRYASRNEILAGDKHYSVKKIRPEHNLRQMLIAGSFEFKGM